MCNNLLAYTTSNKEGYQVNIELSVNKSRHAAHLLHVHIVFVTKYRKKVFGDVHLQFFKRVASSVCQNLEAELIECDGEDDHVHMMITYPPKLSISKLVNTLKASTSKRLRNEFIDLRTHYDKPVLWSRSYFASSCGGAPLEVIKKYIQNQRA